MSPQEADCNTCRHHVQGASLDDVPASCWSCSSSPALPRWEGRDPTTVVKSAIGEALVRRVDAELMKLPLMPLQPPNVPAPPMAVQLLHKAADLMAERGQQYDKPEGERSMGKCVSAFNTITGKGLTEAEGWLLLQLLKDVRQWQREGYHADSAEDCIAYAALKAESLAAQGL